jgi:hypothetical protein
LRSLTSAFGIFCGFNFPAYSISALQAAGYWYFIHSYFWFHAKLRARKD